jgi:hypothetical protein
MGYVKRFSFLQYSYKWILVIRLTGKLKYYSNMVAWREDGVRGEASNDDNAAPNT